jgi:hypothetical protein
MKKIVAAVSVVAVSVFALDRLGRRHVYERLVDGLGDAVVDVWFRAANDDTH